MTKWYIKMFKKMRPFFKKKKNLTVTLQANYMPNKRYSNLGPSSDKRNERMCLYPQVQRHEVLITC